MHDRRTDPAALRALLVERDMTQRQLAARAELSPAMVSKVLNGRPGTPDYRDFSDRAAVRIARALGVHPDQFTTAVSITEYRTVDQRGTAA